MKEYDEWKKSFDAVIYPGLFKTQEEMLEIAFKAGMDAKDKAIVEKYHELLMGVQSKIKDESRHETAKRYIKAAESISSEGGRND